MKLRRVTVNNRKGRLELTTTAGRMWPVPFSRLEPPPSAADPIVRVGIDRELAREAASFVLRSGREGTLHLEQALEYNQDPNYLSDLRTHQLTVEAMRRIDRCGLSRREIARRLGTSLPQLYRLLDPVNTRKSIGQMIALLDVLGSEVELVVKDRRPEKSTGANPRAIAIKQVLVRRRDETARGAKTEQVRRGEAARPVRPRAKRV